jgi:hypothetical protein
LEAHIAKEVPKPRLAGFSLQEYNRRASAYDEKLWAAKCQAWTQKQIGRLTLEVSVFGEVRVSDDSNVIEMTGGAWDRETRQNDFRRIQQALCSNVIF